MAGATKESFARALEGLVRKFEADRETYLSPGYGEAQARSHFITPFFKALGWDVENEAGVPYHLCDVWEEKGETEGRPDYTFRINGQTRFFVEAKAPSVQLDNVAHLLQTKRYAWNSREVFFAGLTDFEQFRFFDASLEPDERRPLDGEAFHLVYTEYLANIDKLWELSRERVAAASLDQFLRRDRKSIRYRVPVDKRFLDELTEWRHDLARSIYTQNPELDPRLLNEIVQRLLDRIVFIRIAEDRKVIEPRQLWDIADLWEESGGRRSIMQFLVDLFATINRDFNGEIFKPHPCEQVKIESSIVAKIIRRLYPPKSPYRFDVIGVELLGSIYERYLGNTLHVTAKQVRIEPKPEVRKAGGVYYTPKFIVDYIVKNTVGKLVEQKTPKEIQRLRVLDPACGSGSFLIGAFQYLIDWQLNYYREHPREARVHPMYPEAVKDLDGNLRLSFHAKTRIMRQNLYGVDLDPQAVEITMMSLYLKALEGEREMLAPKQSVLPELKYNIRCGNSLIGPDIDRETPLSPDERQRIRPFEWHSKEDGFGDILAAGGFDAVIGNPPYLFITEISKTEKRIFAKSYKTFSYRYDVYGLFIEKAVSELLRIGGMMSFITPHTLLSNDSFEKLRRLLLSRTTLYRIVDIGPGVFEGAKNETMVFVAERQDATLIGQKCEVVLTTADSFPNPQHRYLVSQHTWLRTPKARWQVRVSPEAAAILEKLKQAKYRLGDLCEINQGLRTGDNRKFLAASRKSRKWKPAAGGKDVSRYEPLYASAFVLYDPKVLDAPRRKEIFESNEKLVVQEVRNITLSRRIVATYDDKQIFCLQSTNVINLREKAPAARSLKYLLGVLNSGVANFFFRQSFPGNNHIASNQLAEIPVPEAGVRQRELDALVDKMLFVKAVRAGESDEKHQQELDEQIQRTDRQIDDLVCELYGITPEERKVIGKL